MFQCLLNGSLKGLANTKTKYLTTNKHTKENYNDTKRNTYIAIAHRRGSENTLQAQSIDTQSINVDATKIAERVAILIPCEKQITY